MSDIVKAPDQILRNPAKSVTQVDKRLIKIIEDMKKTLLAQKDPEGVGLAAPQIGISLRLFFVRPISASKKNTKLELFINPEITHYSRDTIAPRSKNAMLEGCLSLPFYYGHVKRSKSVTVKYSVINGSELVEKVETFSGFTAQIIQHELDHLNGTLFIDRILSQNGKLFEVRGDKWQEVNL